LHLEGDVDIGLTACSIWLARGRSKVGAGRIKSCHIKTILITVNHFALQSTEVAVN
jgi:hypothetical protein